MPALYSLRSPNGRQILYFVGKTVTGPVISKRLRTIPVPQDAQKGIPNITTREEKITIIGTLVEITEAGEQTGYVDAASQAAAEAATPTGTGQEQMEKLEEWTRSWDNQAGGRNRGATAYPTAGGVTTTGEATLIVGNKSTGAAREYQGIIENITPTQNLDKNDANVPKWGFTLTFVVCKVQGA